jgi:CheY-like chemotaxis protein
MDANPEIVHIGPMDDESKLRILVVDDNVEAAESLSTLLEFSGHQTLIVHSGEEALEHVVAFAPEVAFVDIGLPGLNGYEVAERIRKNPRIRRDLRLVALTGWGADEDRRRAKEAGFDEHLVKPASLDQVRATLTGAD